MTEVVDKCAVGLDLHTGSDRRSNLPQIRADLDDGFTRELAEAFGAPVMLHARIRDGSLRHAARERGATVLLYEAGESLRMDAYAIDAGVVGVRRVLAALGMVDGVDVAPPSAERRVPAPAAGSAPGAPASSTSTRRSARRSPTASGSAPWSTRSARRCAWCTPTAPAVVIGRTEQALVNSGDALVHIASAD